jgi:hypothetical protein
MRTSRPHEHRQGLEAIETQGKQLHELTPHHDLNLMMYHCRSSNCMIRDCPGTIALAYKITSHYPIVSTIVPCVNTAARPHGEGKQNDYKDVVLSSRYIVTRSWPCNVCIWKRPTADRKFKDNTRSGEYLRCAYKICDLPYSDISVNQSSRAIARIVVGQISRDDDKYAIPTKGFVLQDSVHVPKARSYDHLRDSKSLKGILRHDPHYHSMAVCESEHPPRCHSRMRLRLKNSNFHGSVDHCYR